MITEQTQRLWKIDCDKCDGHGKLFTEGIYELIRRERVMKDISAKNVAAVAKIPYTRYCKFENGRTRLSNSRVQKIIEIINNWAAIGEPSFCPECGSGVLCECVAEDYAVE